MAKVRVGSGEAARVGRLLKDIERGAELPSDIRDAAAYWAASMDRVMKREDLQEVAWLLRDASAYRWKSASGPGKARYWAAYLEART